jgi:anthranilate phosphoribosyltransferase
LAALALGQAGFPVLMHGSNEFSGGMTVAQALAVLGLTPSTDPAAAARDLAQGGFAYVPVAALNPVFAELLALRRLLGLRSPLNTVARLLNPADAGAGVDGVFHPPYIETHLAAAERLGRARLLVLKGGGGEVERNPAKPLTANLWDTTAGRSVLTLPALAAPAADTTEPDLAAVWYGVVADPAIEARVVATIALGLLALGQGGDAEAKIVWQSHRAVH